MSTSDPQTLESVHPEEELPVPPAGEEIHLPGASILPLSTAVGVTLLVIGSTIWLGWSAIGLIILLTSIGLWIRDVRHEVDSLPEDHHHG